MLLTKWTNLQLIQQAKLTRNKAYSPYSRFAVGAALLTREGQLYTGCNIENGSYGLTICAERVALFKAISEGEQDFLKIAIITDRDNLVPPCGACLQVFAEFAPPEFEIILSNVNGKYQLCILQEFLPHPFLASTLK